LISWQCYALIIERLKLAVLSNTLSESPFCPDAAYNRNILALHGRPSTGRAFLGFPSGAMGSGRPEYRQAIPRAATILKGMLEAALGPELQLWPEGVGSYTLSQTATFCGQFQGRMLAWG